MKKNKQCNSARQPNVFIIVGGRGCGKTYFLEHSLKQDNTIVFELVKTNRWQGYKKYFYEDFENGAINMRDIANKKIVFEDATAYVNSNMKNGLKKLIVFSKQIGCDVFVVFHSVNIIPPFMWLLFNYIVLFKCPKPRQTALNADYFNEIMQKWKVLEGSKPYSYKVIGSNI